tara:strand:- start:4114 stop:4839 length:726 start_codon:yes stop_codon:yes gene_type:complete
MATRGIAIEAVTIVIRGAFAPAAFSPLWFREQGLIGDSELANHQIEVITQEFAVFRMGWLQCQISTDGMRLGTEEPEEFERLRDAAVGTLQVLRYTPISALGVNRDFHTTMESVDKWHAIGDALAPKAIWEDVLEVPGMRSVTLWGQRPDQYAGHVQVQVEPSVKLPISIYVSTNDHFELTLETKKIRTRAEGWDLTERAAEPSTQKTHLAITVLLDEWAAILQRAESARKKAVTVAGGQS